MQNDSPKPPPFKTSTQDHLEDGARKPQEDKRAIARQQHSPHFTNRAVGDGRGKDTE